MNRGLKFVLFIGALGLTACGRPPVLQVDPVFLPYVERFEKASEAMGNPIQVSDLRLEFGQMQNAMENGACEIVGDEVPTVYINEKAWNRLTEVDREALIFHELGHCVLRRAHVAEIEETGVPKSLMHPYRIQTRVYVANEEAYLKELFARRNDF
jgi:hypothetical protein